MGFAASSNVAKKLLLEEKTFWTGLDNYLLAGPMAEALNVPQEAGLLVQRVAENSPGYLLGLKPGRISVIINEDRVLIGGDIILEVQGVPISMDLHDLKKIRDTIADRSDFSWIAFKVLRAGKMVTLQRSK